MRLDKFLANAKFGSRKEVKRLIKSGKVSVNNLTIFDETYNTLENDLIKCDNVEVINTEFVYYMLNKPAGYVSATKDLLYPVVTSLIADYHDLFPVGRLDVDTVGLLIITNNGDFSHYLTSPKNKIIKQYYVCFNGNYHENIVDKFKEGIVLNDFTCLPADFKKLEGNTCLVSIQEGKFHQVKLMMKSVNLEVTYLKRVKFGSLELDHNLKEGEYRKLTQDEISQLLGE